MKKIVWPKAYSASTEWVLWAGQFPEGRWIFPTSDDSSPKYAGRNKTVEYGHGLTASYGIAPAAASPEF